MKMNKNREKLLTMARSTSLNQKINRQYWMEGGRYAACNDCLVFECTKIHLGCVAADPRHQQPSITLPFVVSKCKECKRPISLDCWHHALRHYRSVSCRAMKQYQCVFNIHTPLCIPRCYSALSGQVARQQRGIKHRKTVKETPCTLLINYN